MQGFLQITGRREELQTIHDGLRAQVAAALQQRERGAARVLIAETMLAALRRDGPNYTELRVRFIRLQADGIELRHRASVRLAFLARQMRRIERKLAESD